ncbi:MAG: NADH-quinone oxidoreductase subunit NuoN [Pseudomonadota bacterium]
MSGDLLVILPEILLAVAAMALLMFGAYGGEDKQASVVLWLSAGVMAAIGVTIATNGGGTSTAFHGSFIDDAYGRMAKVMVLLVAAVMLILSEDYLRRRGMLKFEYPVLILLAVTGMMVMISAGDLIVLYMGLELQSLALYVVAAFNRDSARSTEAGLKYFVLGALSSGMLLYGASLVYGYTGTTSFDGIARVVGSQDEISLGLTFGLVFVCVALAFKISAAPFHMWTPDVYEGSPTPVTAFFATAPKVAAGILFARVLYQGFGDVVADWQQILVFIAIASMFLGAIAAIGQSNLKRLLAYSSIGHMGYALVGLAAGTEEGASALMIYLIIYLVMNLGVFAFILTMERDGQPVATIGDLAGLSRTKPAQAMAVAILMFSLAGLPPLVGFFGKFFVFMAAVNAGLVVLALAGAVASVISAFYYLNIVKVMYLNDPDRPLQLNARIVHSAVLGLAALVMAVGWVPFLDGLGVPELATAAAETFVK